ARVSRRIGEPKIRGEIGDLGPRRGGEEFLDHLLGGPVRQPAEGEVESGTRPVDIVYRDELGQRVMRELREYCPDLLPGLAIGGEQRDLDPRMGDEQPQQLRAGIARSAEHADLCLPRHRSVPSLAAIRTMRTAGILRRREPPQKAKPRNFWKKIRAAGGFPAARREASNARRSRVFAAAAAARACAGD